MEVLRLMPIFLNLLPGALSEGWTIRALPRRAVSRSCVVIPCTFDFPSHRYKALHGAWFKYWHYWKYTVVYTKDPKYGMSTFVGRAKIIGDLEQKNCTLRINNLRPDDSDVYYFYVDLEGFTDHTFTEPVQLQVVHVPDKPEILLHEDITEGNPVNIICKSLFACPDNRPILTWSELPESTVNTVTKNSDEVSTVLTFNPSFKHHGLTVLCTADFPETSHRLVNSVTLSVKYSPRNTLVRMTFTDGNLISLHCSSEGNPAIHRFSWSKLSNGKGTDLSKVGETITVPKGIGEESYSCTATNTLGSSQSPPVRIPTEYDAVILSESKCTRYLTNVTCLCVVQSNSSVEVMWRLPGSSIGVTGSSGIYTTQSTRAGDLVTNTLTINGSNLTFDTINCTVPNSPGRAPSQRQLQIQSVSGPGRAVMSGEWKGVTPREVTAQEGLCAQIPCQYSYPSHLANHPRVGVWFNTEKQIPWAPLAFHSEDHNLESPRLRHRTGLSGDLNDGDCSLIINSITQQDAGPYYFRIEFDNSVSHNYYPVTQLHVSDFTDKPTIFPAGIIAGKCVDISCTFSTTCDGTAPAVTWVNAADVHGSVPNSVTQHGVTLTYTSVLTLIPSLKHHGQTLTCRVSYPSVSSERTLTLTVHYAPRNLSIISRDTIKDSSITITEGNSAVILCSVQSIPASNLMWRHRGVTMNRTRSNNELWLEFLHVTSRVAGDYQCVAENEHGAVEGSMTIAVEHKYPHRERTVAISGATGGVREGSNVTLTCSSESFPPASSYAWFRIDGNTSVQLNTRARSVHFSHVTRGDDASFYCTARNPLDIGRSTIVHLSVEYKPEISWESECIRRAEGITCVCVARSNPPGDLTWNLPLANISGNQSSGHFVAWRVSKGQRVTGSLTLRGGQGEEGATVVCLVRNRHGEAMFKVYLWVKGGACNEWKVGLLVAGIMLSVALVGFVIFKTKAAATERASKPNDIAMTYSHLSAKHQGEQNTVVVDAWNISSDASSEAQTPTPQDLPKGRAGGEAAREQPAKHENLLYANINLLKLPSGDGTVHGGKGTDCILCN